MGLALPDQDIDPVPGLKVFARKRILAAVRPPLDPIPPVICPPSDDGVQETIRQLVNPNFTVDFKTTMNRTPFPDIRVRPDFTVDFAATMNRTVLPDSDITPNFTVGFETTMQRIKIAQAITATFTVTTP